MRSNGKSTVPCLMEQSDSDLIYYRRFFVRSKSNPGWILAAFCGERAGCVIDGSRSGRTSSFPHFRMSKKGLYTTVGVVVVAALVYYVGFRQPAGEEQAQVTPPPPPPPPAAADNTSGVTYQNLTANETRQLIQSCRGQPGGENTTEVSLYTLTLPGKSWATASATSYENALASARTSLAKAIQTGFGDITKGLMNGKKGVVLTVENRTPEIRTADCTSLNAATPTTGTTFTVTCGFDKVIDGAYAICL